MSGVLSLLPEGTDIRDILSQASFDVRSQNYSNLTGTTSWEIANLLMMRALEQLSGKDLQDPEVMPNLACLVLSLYCLGEGVWEDRGRYAPSYFKQVLAESYRQEELNSSEIFGKMVLRLNRAIRNPHTCEGTLGASLNAILTDCKEDTDIGTRLRVLSVFILALLVASEISCESLGMLNFVSLFQ